MSWGGSASTVTGFGLDDQDSNPDWGQRIFPLASANRPVQGPTQPPIQWVPGSFPEGKARLGRGADHSPPSIAEVKNEQEIYLLSHQVPTWRIVG
ncbi:hypothetical protein L798_03788 [Zootermopsis nevadensis]|uniref:Uncharacterized protein n=1 Tax=Zootermopsis nevadensis TaxID=136037 RepID=A0A067RF83_ZOONE|nr:hypothetical protein L798_03788 [Zootermopsis nevadensis]